MSSYERLEAENAKPKRIVDHSVKWAQLRPVGAVSGQIRERIDAFCERKRISFAALEQFDTRVTTRKSGGVWLAWAGRSATGNAVTAVKYRPVDGSSHDTVAEAPSVWLRPLVAGKLDSLDYFLSEGETDACRLLDLVGDAAAVMALPAGANTFRREWADPIPRGATVHLCADADADGDKGAAKAAGIIGGTTVRVRPSDGANDWCDWQGGREDFVRLVSQARAAGRSYQFGTLADFLAHPYPEAEPLLGKPGEIFLAVGTLLIVYGSDGAGKSTWLVDLVAHLAAGRDWLGIHVPRPVRFCVVENEGPPGLFQQKLAEKAESWNGPDWSANVHAFKGPWGEFTFADAGARHALREYCEEHAIDAVVANPTLGLGVAASGRPDETQQFVDWLVECGLKTTRAFLLAHHENKSGQISGDWGRHPDTKVQLQQDANRARTKLIWEKTRWATLPTDERPKACLLEWVVETKGYNVVELDTAGASDSELTARLDAFLTDHPWSSTRAVYDAVKGSKERLRALLDSDRYDSVNGPRGATLWSQASDRSESSNGTPEQ